MSTTERTLNCIKAFRHAVVETLKTANIPGIGSNVSASREMKAWPEEESYIIVNVPSIEFNDKGTNPRFYFSKADLIIDIYARSFLKDEQNLENVESASDLNDFLDDAMNAVAAAVEPCPFWRGPYRGLVSKCVLRSYGNNLSQRSEAVRGSARISFEVSFTARVFTAEELKDFLRAKNDLQTNGVSMEFTTVLQPGNKTEETTTGDSVQP